MIAIINCNKDKSCIGRLVGAISLINQATLVINEEILGRMEQEEIPINDCKCAIISGSAKLAAKGDTNKELEDFIKNWKEPILGICYGHQIVAKVCGCELGNGEKIESEVDKGNGQVIHILGDRDIFKGLREPIMSESHYDYVIPSPKIEILATSSTCDIEAFRCGNRYGTQFHPERSGKDGIKLLENFVNIV